MSPLQEPQRYHAESTPTRLRASVWVTPKSLAKRAKETVHGNDSARCDADDEATTNQDSASMSCLHSWNAALKDLLRARWLHRFSQSPKTKKRETTQHNFKQERETPIRDTRQTNANRAQDSSSPSFTRFASKEQPSLETQTTTTTIKTTAGNLTHAKNDNSVASRLRGSVTCATPCQHSSDGDPRLSHRLTWCGSDLCNHPHRVRPQRHSQPQTTQVRAQLKDKERRRPTTTMKTSGDG
jgi:hypothetical protein